MKKKLLIINEIIKDTQRLPVGKYILEEKANKFYNGSKIIRIKYVSFIPLVEENLKNKHNNPFILYASLEEVVQFLEKFFEKNVEAFEIWDQDF